MAASSTYSLPRCPVEVTLSLISSRWVVLILRELIYGTRRFGQIRKALGGVSTKVLTQNLRTMEENGLLTRETFAEVPPRVEYTLTDLGQSLRPVLFSMVEWGSQYAQLREHRRSVRCATGEVLIVPRNGDAYVALNEEGNEVARIVPTDAVWAVEINDPYRAHVDEAAFIAAAEVLGQD